MLGSLDCCYHYCWLENWLSQSNCCWLTTGIQSVAPIDIQVSPKIVVSRYWNKLILHCHLSSIVWLCLIDGLLYASRILAASVFCKCSFKLSNPSVGSHSQLEFKIHLNLLKAPGPWLHKPDFHGYPSLRFPGPTYFILEILTLASIAVFLNFIFCAGCIWRLYVCGCALYNYSNVTEPAKYSLGFAYHPLLSLTFLSFLRFLSLYTWQ